MKLIRIITKNIRVLFRSRGSAVMTVFGPLLIIVLVGLAFNNSKSFEFSTGVYSQEYSRLTESFILNLEKDNFNVVRFSSEEECVQKIREGVVHTCIIFPDDFRIENDVTNEITIFVDNSRTNLVYQVISSLSQNIDVKTDELSLGLTNTLIQMLMSTKDGLNSDIIKINTLRNSMQSTKGIADRALNNLNSIDLSFDNVDVSSVLQSSQGIMLSVTELRDKGWQIADQAKFYAREIEDNTSYSTADFVESMDKFRQEVTEIYNATPGKMSAINSAVNSAKENLEDLQNRVASTTTSIQDIAERLREIGSELDAYQSDLQLLQSSLESHVKNIDNLKVTSAHSIVSPVKTRVEPVSAQTSKLIFLFPNLLVLLIMFISLLLSGTIIIMEKSSRAFFRNFITPTRDSKFIFANYLTSIFIVLCQIVIIIGLAFFFLKSPLFTNFHITFIVLLLSITLFVLIGMFIGSIFSTQEGVMMITISIGTVFLLLSDFILPLEDISGFLSSIARFNPFVIASEAIKKSMLFGSPLSDMLFSLGILVLYCVVAFMLLTLSKKLSRERYFQTLPAIFRKDKIQSPEDTYLKLGKGIVIKSKQELIDALAQMTDTEFKGHCYESNNDFSIWVGGVLQEKALARKLNGKSRQEMIRILKQKK